MRLTEITFNLFKKFTLFKRTISRVEREMADAKIRYKMFENTFFLQHSFSDGQRDRLIELRVRLEALEAELLALKFKEVVHGYNVQG